MNLHLFIRKLFIFSDELQILKKMLFEKIEDRKSPEHKV